MKAALDAEAGYMLRLSLSAVKEWASSQRASSQGGAAFGGAAASQGNTQPSCRLGDVIDMSSNPAIQRFFTQKWIPYLLRCLHEAPGAFWCASGQHPEQTPAGKGGKACKAAACTETHT